ncbi:MAG: copper homeostasis protein CutC [Propioniciclava sp.]
MGGILEVGILSAHDALPATAGGADRLHLYRMTDDGPMSPEPREVAAVRGRTDSDLRVSVRLREGYSTDGGELVRLRGLISSYLDAGATGIVLGFLNGLGDVDREVIAGVLSETTCPWTFSRAVDACLDADAAWVTLVELPRLDSVQTAGSARSIHHGLDYLVRTAAGCPRAAELIVAAGDLHADQVPWLARVGVSQFRVDAQVRPDGSARAYVDEALVRSWRLLVDEQMRHGPE